MNADLCVGFSKSDWEALAPSLGSNDDKAWALGVGVFERRMQERFFRPIDALITADTKPDLTGNRDADHCIPGFAIVALCCLLIESLQSFREEAMPTDEPKEPCTYPTGHCIRPVPGTNQQFTAFLQHATFNGAFNKLITKAFMHGIRNGILHEAETRKWVIWREEPKGSIVQPEDDGYALNRTLFYDAIKSEFATYLHELRNPTNGERRKRFLKKMNDLVHES